MSPARRLRKDGLAGQRRFSNLSGNLDRPGVVAVVSVSERDDRSGVGDALHARENPRRCERSLGPLILPAWHRNRWLPSSTPARSSCCRTTRLAGRPVLLAVSESQAASSGLRRVVSFLPIRPKRNTDGSERSVIHVGAIQKGHAAILMMRFEERGQLRHHRLVRGVAGVGRIRG